MRYLVRVSKRLQGLQEWRTTLEKRREKCQQLNMPFGPEEQAFLKLFHEYEEDVSKDMERAQTSCTLSEEACHAAGLLDQDGAPTETF